MILFGFKLSSKVSAIIKSIVFLTIPSRFF